MPANPLPANVKQLRGRHDGVDSGGRPIPEVPAFKRVAPEKPSDLDPVAESMWDDVVKDLMKLDLLKELDGKALRGMCEAYSRWAIAVEKRKHNGIVFLNEDTGMWHKAPWVTVEEVAAKELMGWYSKFGMTPSDEMKLAKEVGEGGGKANGTDAFPG